MEDLALLPNSDANLLLTDTRVAAVVFRFLPSGFPKESSFTHITGNTHNAIRLTSSQLQRERSVDTKRASQLQRERSVDTKRAFSTRSLFNRNGVTYL